MHCVFGKGALEVFAVEFSVYPELVVCVPPRVRDLSDLEGVFVFHLHGDASELFGKAGPLCLREGKGSGIVVWVLFPVEDLADKVDRLFSLHVQKTIFNYITLNTLLIYYFSHFVVEMAYNKGSYDIEGMEMDDVWFVRLYFCKGNNDKEAFAVEGNLYRRLQFKYGEERDYVFHAENTVYPKYEEGFLMLIDEHLEFFEFETDRSTHVGETCRIKVISPIAKEMGLARGMPQFSRSLLHFSILNEEGIQFDRLSIWPKSGESDSSEGVNGFVSITKTQKDIDEEVLGHRVHLKKGTPIIVKFLGQKKHWLTSVVYGDQAFGEAYTESGSEKKMNEFKKTYDKETFEKEIQKILQNVRVADKDEATDYTKLTEIELRKEMQRRIESDEEYLTQKYLSEKQRTKTLERLKQWKEPEKKRKDEIVTLLQKDDAKDNLESSYTSKEYLERFFYISKSVSKDLLREATLQQEAAVAGLAPFVYGYNENAPNFEMTMQVIPTAVDSKGMNNAYRRGPMSHRMQLAALAHELDQLKIHHNDFKPDNYRLDGERLYLIDFGLAKRFDFDPTYSKPTNVAALNMAGYSYSARPSAVSNVFNNLETEIKRRDDLGDIEAYDHEKATRRKYRRGEKVLLDVELPSGYVQYMLYECTGRNSSQQNNILPPFVERKKREYLFPVRNSSYCHVEGNYYDYLDKGILNRKIKRDTNANDRPSWKALWVHSTIPYTMEECLAERRRVLDKEKMRKMFKDEFGQEMTTTSRGLQLKF